VFRAVEGQSVSGPAQHREEEREQHLHTSGPRSRQWTSLHTFIIVNEIEKSSGLCCTGEKTRSGATRLQPTYSRNRVSLIGSFTIAYDANGRGSQSDHRGIRRGIDRE
jgi:hypothetical protein